MKVSETSYYSNARNFEVQTLHYRAPEVHDTYNYNNNHIDLITIASSGETSFFWKFFSATKNSTHHISYDLMLLLYILIIFVAYIRHKFWQTD
jgi:uroporphyrinogen-III synthase